MGSSETLLVSSTPQTILLGFVLLAAFLFIKRETLYPNIPIGGLDGTDYGKAKRRFISNSKEILYGSFQQLKRPFQVLTPNGPKIILPSRYSNEIKSNPLLSFADWNANEFYAHLSGLEGFREVLATPVFVETVKGRLTPALGNLTDGFREEIKAVMAERLGDKEEWTGTTLAPWCLYLLARLSTRAFLGPELCRDEEWLNIFITFTVECFYAVHDLRTWPAFLRPIANIFLPHSREVRRQVSRARTLIEPQLQKRRQMREKELAEQQQPGTAKKNRGATDTLGWMDEVAKGRPYDPVTNQLFFSLFALHTTSGLLTNIMLDICAHPQYVEPLREEIKAVVAEDGWDKKAFYNMRLLDSFMKESARLHPLGLVVIQRIARGEVRLHDGTVIPKGATVSCLLDKMMDPAVYPDPEKFDGYRFLRMREQTGQENAWQLVSTSDSHLGFGLGTHACPGRFFAANEAKVALAYMLVNYDWRFPDGQTQRPESHTSSIESVPDPTAKVLFRRRKETLE